MTKIDRIARDAAFARLNELRVAADLPAYKRARNIDVMNAEIRKLAPPKSGASEFTAWLRANNINPKTARAKLRRHKTVAGHVHASRYDLTDEIKTLLLA